MTTSGFANAEISHTPVNFTSQFRSPAPPISDTMKPKFEPIQKMDSKHIENKQRVFKPTPVTPAAKSAFTSYTENASHKSNQSKSYYYASTGPQTTQTHYYTAVSGQPVHNALATETSNTMHMKETTENSHRVVNISNTQRIVSLEPTIRAHQPAELEPFPYSPDTTSRDKMHQRVPPPPTPIRFVPGEFRDSDYDSEMENSRIRPIWTPNQNESGEKHYRRVRPPSSRSASVPRSYDRVMTPMEFDTLPVEMPSKITIDSPTMKSPQQYFTSSAYRNAIHQKSHASRDDSHIMSKSYSSKSSSMIEHASQQVNGMNASFKNKAGQFMRDVITDAQQHQKPILKKSTGAASDSSSAPQAYRNESRVSKYGEYDESHAFSESFFVFCSL